MRKWAFHKILQHGKAQTPVFVFTRTLRYYISNYFFSYNNAIGIKYLRIKLWKSQNNFQENFKTFDVFICKYFDILYWRYSNYLRSFVYTFYYTLQCVFYRPHIKRRLKIYKFKVTTVSLWTYRLLGFYFVRKTEQIFF